MGKGANGMTIIVVAAVAFVALVGAVLLVVSRENNDYAKFAAGVEEFNRRIIALEKKVDENHETFQEAANNGMNEKAEFRRQLSALEEQSRNQESKINTASDLAHRANVSLARKPALPIGPVNVNVQGTLPIRIIDNRKPATKNKTTTRGDDATPKRKNKNRN